jgi:hypothetical protein
MSMQMYAEPVSPWALNATQLDRLRARVAEGEAEIASPKLRALPWPERTRREAEVKSWRRELQMAEFESVLEVRRKALHRRPAQPAPVAANAGRQEYAPPVAYFAEPPQMQAVTATRSARPPAPCQHTQFVVNVGSGWLGATAR